MSWNWFFFSILTANHSMTQSFPIAAVVRQTLLPLRAAMSVPQRHDDVLTPTGHTEWAEHQGLTPLEGHKAAIPTAAWQLFPFSFFLILWKEILISFLAAAAVGIVRHVECDVQEGCQLSPKRSSGWQLSSADHQRAELQNDSGADVPVDSQRSNTTFNELLCLWRRW